MKNFKETANFIWSIADLLRGDYKQSDYGKVILPLTVLRRLGCVLEGSKEKVLKTATTLTIENVDPILNKAAGYKFHNRSKYNFDKLVADPNNLAVNLRTYINGFSEDAREIIEQFEFDNQITKLDDGNLLFMVIKRFQEVDLHRDAVSSMEMGYMFEELIRKFAELSNETAGEHFTPREVIKLMVNILFLNDRDILTKKGIVKTIYDCCAGTGGMLSVAEEYLNELNPDARLEVFGQELNAESYAICKSDMLIKGQNASNIKKGKPKPNSKLRDTENIPLKEDITAYMKREVLPHVPDLPAPKPLKGEYCVYVLKCADDSFYKGQTNDFVRRMKEHENGEVSWTAKNLPVEPVHWEVLNTREEAVEREKYLKSGRGREWIKAQYEAKKLKSFERQAGAWIDESKTLTGYEINFTKYFYEYKPLRSLEEIKADIFALEADTHDGIQNVLS